MARNTYILAASVLLSRKGGPCFISSGIERNAAARNMHGVLISIDRSFVIIRCEKSESI